MGFNHDNPQYLVTTHDSPITDLKRFKNEYAMSLCIPSVSSSYSICVEYMRKWFKNKFQPDFVKSEYIAGRNILRDFLSNDMINNIRKNKPALAIRPRMDYTFNRENTDLYLLGRNIINNRTRFKDCFFVNPTNKNMVSLTLEQWKVDFEFRIKVSSFNTAMDLYKFMQIACRANATETRYAEIDFNVPKALMLAIAKDSGFEIRNEQVVDNCKFLSFLNKNSRLPFVCKFRGTKGEYEYFIKLTDMYVHLRCGDIEVDEGEREGQTDNNFVVSTQIECLFPAPKFYAYYAKDKHDFALIDKALKCTIYNLYIGAIPFKNEKGWNQYMTTDYIEDNDIYEQHKPSTIHFKELIQSRNENSLFDIAEYTKSIFISPSVFMDVKLFNGLSEVPIQIDWNTYTISTNQPLVERTSELVFYIDLEFINNYAINTQKGYSNRVKDQNNNI